jgi:gliding motility-associated-like protein/uncharacterized repeat protein (TIGR01451 family)
MKLIFSLKPILFLLAIFACNLLQAQVVRPFTIYYQNNQKGGIVYISNVSVSCGNAAGCAAAEAEISPNGTSQNNDFNQEYVDVDGDTATYMSSSDSLNLPQCSNITYAGLFWGGSVNNATPNFVNRNKVKIKANGGAYVEIEADSLVSNNSGSITYHCYKNITGIAQANGKFARYTVADLVTQTGSANRFGGWTLVIAYRNDLETLKNLTVFGGVANISTTFTPVQIDLTGFLTPPTGPVALEMGVVAYDGDRGFFQDSLYFNGAGTFIPVSDLLNPTRDIFNSTIQNKGVENPFRIPFLHNTMGWDADIFAPDNSTKNYIGNNATTASLRLTTGNENYYAQVVTTAIDVFEPDIRIGNTSIDINGAPLNPGDTLLYTVTIQNLGSDTAINVQLIDTIPFNLDYVAGSIQVIAGANQGFKTDGFGDDQAEYDPIGNRVIVRVGNGANASQGGSIGDSPTGADSSTFTFRGTVTQECVKLRCSGFVNSIVSGIGTGLLSGNTQTNYSNPSILDPFGCPIPGFTSTSINLPPSCVLPPDTAFSACPPFLFGSLATALPGYVYFNAGFNPIAVATSSATYFGIKTLTAGCTDTIALNITIFPNPAFTSVSKTDPTCGLPNSGSFVLNGISPTDSIAFTVGNIHSNASPYVVVSSLFPANTFDTLTAGNYTIRLKNATNCTIDQVINLAPAANCAPTAVDDNFTTNEDTQLSADVSTNDVDLNGDPLSYSVLTSLSNGTVLMNPNGTFTYTPNANFNGIDTLIYLVCDNGAPSLCDTGMAIITVLPINDAPTALNDTISVNEDNILNSTVAANDSDLEGNNLSFTVFLNPTNGTLILNLNGTYTYTPNPNFNGVDSFTYTVCDDGIPSLCTNAVVTITVNPINDAPVAVNDVFITNQNVALNGNVSPNDSDVDGDPLNFVVLINPLHGAVAMNANGSFLYTPNAGYSGPDTLTYVVCDNGNPALCDTAIVVFNIIAVSSNQVPIGLNDGYTTNEDTQLPNDVSTNDSDPDGNPLSFAVVTNPSNGTLSLAANGTFTYSPFLNFNGTDSFTYQVCDNGLPVLCDTATVTINVVPINDAPIAVDDNFSTNQNTNLNADVSPNDSDVDLDPLNYTIVTNPTNGGVTLNPNGTFLYVPNAGFTGVDTFVYEVCDGAAPQLCDQALVTITVLPNVNLALVGVAKSVSNPVSIGNGQFTLTYTIIIKNYGNAIANNVQVVDNLDATFPAPAIFVVNSLSSAVLSPNLNYNGKSDINLLEPLTNQLAPGASDTLVLNLTVTPGNSAGPFNNSAVASANGIAADSSANGNNPDPNNDGNPNEQGVTPVTFAIQERIGLSKSVEVLAEKTDGSFDILYTFQVQNMGSVNLREVQLIDDLSTTFPSPVTFSLISITTNGGLTPSTTFTGIAPNNNLLNSQTSTLAISQTHKVELKLNINTNGTLGTYLNSADVYARDVVFNNITRDKSNNLRIDPNQNGNPGDQGEDTPTPVTLDGLPSVIVIPQGFTPDGDVQNEFFVIPSISDYPKNVLTIYNRWGNIVYQRTGYDNTWNGFSDSGDGKVTQGTYYYVLELNKDDLEPRKGYVVIEY